MAHEVSVTFPLNGKWVNAPSVVNGQRLSEDQVRDLVISGQLQPHGVFPSMEAAVAAAQERSSSFDEMEPDQRLDAIMQKIEGADRGSLAPALQELFRLQGGIRQ